MLQSCSLAEPWPIQRMHHEEPSKLLSPKTWIWRRISLPNPGLWGPFAFAQLIFLGHREVRVYGGTGVSRRVGPTTWERSHKNWELQILGFEEFLWERNTLGLVPARHPHTLGYACTFYARTSPPPVSGPTISSEYGFGEYGFSVPPPSRVRSAWNV